MIGSPLNLEILLHYYYSGVPHPYIDTPSGITALNHLLKNDVIIVDLEGSKGIYKTTKKTEFYIKHLMSIPFPVENWTIPI